jgi:hypothetical protein
MAVEWIHPIDGTVIPGESVQNEAKHVFRAPFRGDAVLHLRR